MPSTTVALRVCPDGNDGELSAGGTAREIGGLARPVRSLPTTVNSTDPAAAMPMSSTGSQDRRFSGEHGDDDDGDDRHPDRAAEVGEVG